MTRLALTACIAAALLPAAALAQTSIAEIRFADLDLSSSAGMATLEQRIEAASKQACRNTSATGSRILAARLERQCKAEIRHEIEEKMADKGIAIARN